MSCFCRTHDNTDSDLILPLSSSRAGTMPKAVSGGCSGQATDLWQLMTWPEERREGSKQAVSCLYFSLPWPVALETIGEVATMTKVLSPLVMVALTYDSLWVLVGFEREDETFAFAWIFPYLRWLSQLLIWKWSVPTKLWVFLCDVVPLYLTLCIVKDTFLFFVPIGDSSRYYSVCGSGNDYKARLFNLYLSKKSGSLIFVLKSTYHVCCKTRHFTEYLVVMVPPEFPYRRSSTYQVDMSGNRRGGWKLHLHGNFKNIEQTSVVPIKE